MKIKIRPANEEAIPSLAFPFETIIVPKHNEIVCTNRNVAHHSNQNGLIELFHCGGIAQSSKNQRKPNIIANVMGGLVGSRSIILRFQVQTRPNPHPYTTTESE